MIVGLLVNKTLKKKMIIIKTYFPLIFLNKKELIGKGCVYFTYHTHEQFVQFQYK